MAASLAEESAAITTIGEALIGTDKPFAVCSGTPWIPGRLSDESDPLPTEGPVGGRAVTVTKTLALSEQGVRTSAVRLPRTVHQDGEGGFAGLLTRIARDSGVSGYPGDGDQRWPAVHSADAAALFRLALELAPAGTSWHAVAEVIGRRLGLPVKPVPVATYGPVGPIFAMDQPSSSTQTQAVLGWAPTHPSLLEDLELVAP